MAEYIEYHPLKFWLDPASIAEIVAHIQSYLVANPINSTTEIETIIHDYLIAHPEIIGGVRSINGETGEVVLTADNISGGENVTIKDVLDSLQDQIDDIVASIPSDYQQLINDVSDLKSALSSTGILEAGWTDICTITHGGGTYTTNVAVGEIVSTEIIPSTSFGCQLVAVNAGDKFLVSGTGGNNPLLWAFTDTAYHLISKALASTQPQSIEITAPENGYLFVNSKTAGGTTYSLYQYLQKSEIATKVDELISDTYTIVDVDLSDKIVLYRYFVTNGGIGTVVDFNSPVINTQRMYVVDECKKDQKYKITGLGGNAPRLWCFVDGENKIVTVSSTNLSVTDLIITAPTDGKLIYETSTTNDYGITKLDVKLTQLQHFEMEINDYIKYTGFDMFRTIGALGDSYTEGDLVKPNQQWITISGINYLDCIAKRNGVTAYNYGSGGANTKTYLTRTAFSNCLNADPHDFYMICFGINDATSGIPIGSIADINDADYTLNADTFYGNYGRIMAQLMAHAPSAKFVLIMPWPTDADYSNYNEAVAEIANHYAIPCINPSDDIFFKSHFWLFYKSGGHPTAMLYSGMARAMERLFNICVQKNPKYFRFSMIE